MFWERVLRHHYIMYKEQEEAKWGKGKRARKTVNYSEQGTKAKEKKDSDYMELSPESSSGEDENGDSEGTKGTLSFSRLYAPNWFIELMRGNVLLAPFEAFQFISAFPALNKICDKLDQF